MPVAFVPLTQAPTHVGAFRQPVPATAVAAPPALANVQFPMRLRAAFGANPNADPSTWTWTDITDDVRRKDGVAVRRGRADTASQTQPTQLTFAVNNSSGNWTPRNALGANYPYVRLGLPIEWAIWTGDTWTVRATVNVDTITPGWDQALAAPTAAISASGILRQLAQGRTALLSPFTRSILAAGPLHFWPCEDSSLATSAGSATTGDAAMQSNGLVTFAALDPDHPNAPISVTPGTHFGFGKVPQLNAGGKLTATFSPTIATAWTLQFRVFNNTSNSAVGPQAIAEWHTTDGATWQLIADVNGLNPFYVSRNYTLVATIGSTPLGSDVRIDAAQSGSNINVTIKAGFSASFIGSGSVAGTLAGVSSFTANPYTLVLGGDLSVSHVRVWNGNSAPDFAVALGSAPSAWFGWVGETASGRVARLASERGVRCAVLGAGSAVTLGAQATSTLLDTMREAEATDSGILADGLAGGISYLPGNARYNIPAAFVLDMAQHQLGQPFGPAEDDQRRRNDWTVTKSGTSSAHYVDATGPQGTNAVNTYDDSATVNPQSDSDLINQAGWRVHLGTVEQMRYPRVMMNLLASPELVSQWRVADLGSRFTLRNLPSQHQPGDVDLVIEGYTEFCDGQQWTVGLDSSPFDPWQVFTIGDPVLGRIDTDFSILRAPLAALAQGTVDTLTVDVLAGPLWTTTATYPADFPFDINVDGERITVTGISGTTAPQTFTVTRATNGVVKTHQIGAPVNIWTRAAIAL